MKISRQIARTIQSKTARGFLTVLALTIAASTTALAESTNSNHPDHTFQKSEKHVLIAEGTATIPWQNNLSKTLKLARDKKKWILVDVFTDWCHWCKRLDADVYAKPSVANFLNKSFVCMKANAERGDGVAVKNKYQVNGYPCTLILEPGGAEKGRIEGYLPAGQFAQQIAQILKK